MLTIPNIERILETYGIENSLTRNLIANAILDLRDREVNDAEPT